MPFKFNTNEFKMSFRQAGSKVKTAFSLAFNIGSLKSTKKGYDHISKAIDDSTSLRITEKVNHSEGRGTDWSYNFVTILTIKHHRNPQDTEREKALKSINITFHKLASITQLLQHWSLVKELSWTIKDIFMYL